MAPKEYFFDADQANFSDVNDIVLISCLNENSRSIKCCSSENKIFTRVCQMFILNDQWRRPLIDEEKIKKLGNIKGIFRERYKLQKIKEDRYTYENERIEEDKRERMRM
ncbi:hypothetical protein PMAC_003084 [Pneumocystis sp. 'macacae']|nr:hypothetical protein PMAC_003084 [Pneumocystis sp. 'macacae']